MSETNIKWANNIGKRLFKSVTFSIGDSRVKKEAGYYCQCGNYNKTESKCQMIRTRYNENKLLNTIIKRTNGAINNIQDAYTYIHDMGLEFDDFEDEVETYVCDTDMIYKPVHYVDESHIIDHHEFNNDFTEMWDELNSKNSKP